MIFQKKSRHMSVGVSAVLLGATAATVGAAETSQAGYLEEVIVTAQRREQRLQDVPIAVSVITAEAAAARGIVDTESLQNAVPGLTFTKGAAYGLPVVRGVGTNTVSQGNENSVAVYVDGVIQLAPSASVFSFNNIERVEVLKGPQGTLFGRNATGGVINVITRTPSQTPQLEVALTGANYDTYEGNLYGSTGLTDRLAADLALFVRNQDQGWGRNLYTGEKVFRSEELAARSKWRWELSSATQLTFGGSYVRVKDDSMSLHPAPGDVGVDGVTTYQGMYNVSMDNSMIGGRSFAERKSWVLDAHLTHDFGWGRFVSISGFSEVEVERPTDSDWTPLTVLHAFVDQFDGGFTQEFQLQSAANSPLQWIGGLYYLDSTSEFEAPRGIQIMGAAIGGLDFLRIISKQDAKSYAVFAELTMNVLQDTRLTLGGRQTRDERDVSGYFEFPTGPTPTERQSAKFDKFTYRVSVDHNLAQDVLAYVSYSTGFKSGLFNLTNVAGDAVDPETIEATEVGIKSILLERRLQLNASIFRYDYDDIQAEVVRSEAGGVLQLLNAAYAVIEGADLDLVFAPTADLTLHGGLSYLDATYRSFPDAVAYIPNPAGGRVEIGADASGQHMIKAPRLQWNVGGQYRIELPAGALELAGSYSSQSEFFWDFMNDFREPSRDMVAASVAWMPSPMWEIRAWGRNLLGEEITSFGLPSVWGFQQSPGAPRTYGVTFKMRL